MNAAPARFDFVTVRSADVDRRALSQAWYDALHIAHDSLRSGARRGDIPLRDAQDCSRTHYPGGACPERSVAKSRGEKLERPSGNVRRAGHPSLRILGERRARLSALAEEIVKRLRSDPLAVRMTFKIPEGRVCVYVLRGEHGVKLFALCPSSVRGVVERALVQARYVLC